MWRNIKSNLIDIDTHVKNKQFNKFRLEYFYGFTVLVGVIAIFCSAIWILKDLKFVGDSDIWNCSIYRLIPLIMLPFYFIFKNKKQYTWVLTFLSVWLSILSTLLFSYKVSDGGLTGDGWISYYVLFFGLSMSVPYQSITFISNVAYTLLVVLTSDQYFGTIHYTESIWRPITTGIIIGGGLMIAAILMGKAIARLYDTEEKLKGLAKVDMLSGLYNRHKLDDITDDGNLRKPSTLMIIDVDKFKDINDAFGHLGGDDAIVYTSNILRSICRKNDILVRYGGDEFIIIFDGFVDENIIFKRLKKSLTKDNKYHITFSIGAYNCSKENLNLDTAIRLADKALYYSKNNGKDQLTIYSALLA